MMSKNFFFKVMKEDLRHKVWMMALSVLGNFLMLTVVWLIWQSNHTEHVEWLAREGLAVGTADGRELPIGETISFFRHYAALTGGITAIFGAVITGLLGFRFVFRKNMVDAYHSLPVKRSTLFAAGYLDGFLIWFVPFFTFYLSTAALAAGYLGKFGGTGQDVGRLVSEAALTMAVTATAFLLTYGLVLTAVMLSGNILNTLVCMGILGLGAISAFGGVYVFLLSYMDRYFDMWDWGAISHVSPLFAALALPVETSMPEVGTGAVLGKMALDLALGLLLGWCAWRLYRKRDSELAEQGVRNRGMAAMMKITAGIVNGMYGWILFMTFTAGRSFLWGLFGLALGGALSFGVLNIIFAMDFKAFFAHKRQMAAMLAAGLLLCAAFHWDWIGYDDYLPKTGSIAEAAVYVDDFSNRFRYVRAEDSPLWQMHFQDADAVYAFLEQAVDMEPEEVWRRVYTRVTGQNGRSYYREYSIGKEDIDIIWPLVSSREYLGSAFVISEEMRESCETFRLQRLGHMEQFETLHFTPEAFAGIVEAYNQDVLKDPEGTFRSGGKRLVGISFDMRGENGNFSVEISVYDTMERTVAALEDAGLGEWVEELDPGELASVTLTLRDYSGSGPDAEETIARAREWYGVYGSGENLRDEEKSMPAESDRTYADRVAEPMPMVEITDSGEIAELCALMDYDWFCQSDYVFRNGCVQIFLTDGEGNSYTGYLERGVLPEKYILRFGDCS